VKLSVEHGLDLDEARRRLAQAAERHDLEFVAAPDGMSGTLAKSAPFLGRVRASYRLGAKALDVEVLERPSLLPEATLRRMIEDELRRVLA
jgi:hypothetical protein